MNKKPGFSSGPTSDTRVRIVVDAACSDEEQKTRFLVYGKETYQ